MKASFTIPMLPMSLNANGRLHRNKQIQAEKQWKEIVAVEWHKLGKPHFNQIKVTMIFTFTDKCQRDSVSYLATGCKFTGDALRGLFISDDTPEFLAEWAFRFQTADEPETRIIIEEIKPEGKEHPRASCSLYTSCIAPLCPIDADSLEGVWYPGEKICQAKAGNCLPWVKAQRKIAKSEAERNGYFTLAMLNHDCVIRKGISGLDPDKEDKQQVKKWMEEHPGTSPLVSDKGDERRGGNKKGERHKTENSPPPGERYNTIILHRVKNRLSPEIILPPQRHLMPLPCIKSSDARQSGGEEKKNDCRAFSGGRRKKYKRRIFRDLT